MLKSAELSVFLLLRRALVSLVVLGHPPTASPKEPQDHFSLVLNKSLQSQPLRPEVCTGRQS